MKPVYPTNTNGNANANTRLGNSYVNSVSSGAALRFSGCSLFRQRLVAATLSGRAVTIRDIRSEDPHAQGSTGLADYEASFLRLIDSLTDGNYNSTSVLTATLSVF